MLFVPDFLAKENVTITLTNGIDENGSPKKVSEFTVKGRVEEANAVIFETDGKKVQLSRKVFIFESLDNFNDKVEGTCLIDKSSFKIYNSKRLKNPDGSLNHVVLELM